VVVDGVVYGRQRFGGINAIYNEILPRMAQQPGVNVELLVPRRCRAEHLPGGAVRHRRREFVGRQTGWSWKLDAWVVSKAAGLVNGALQCAQLKLGEPCVFQSTYFTWPSCNVPQVATAHDMNHELLPQYYQWDGGQWLRRQYREYIRRATRVIAVSHCTKQDVVDIYGVDPAQIDVVHLAVNHQAFYPSAPEEAARERRRPYLLFVGMRHSYKNFAGLLEATRRLPRPELELVVAGSPWTDDERQMIQDLGVESRVRLVAHPDVGELRQLYSECEAFVFPSFHEGFGLPLLEAMACGAAVLASDTEIFREVCGAAALFFDPHDPDAIAESIMALTEGVRRAELAEEGRERAQQFSWDRCAAETVEAYRRALVASMSSRTAGV
jgi:glycosyltransferase involved in cell wall biosynthesis